MKVVAKIQQTLTNYVLLDVDSTDDIYDDVHQALCDGTIDYSDFEVTDTSIETREPRDYELKYLHPIKLPKTDG